MWPRARPPLRGTGASAVLGEGLVSHRPETRETSERQDANGGHRTGGGSTTMRRLFSLVGAATVIGPLAAVGIATAPAAGAQTRGHPGTFRVVADHLNNPRGLAPAPGGGLYLAEAGRGGKTCISGGEMGTLCLGLTGSFDLVTRHGVKRLVTELFSGSGKGGVGAEGPVSV